MNCNFLIEAEDGICVSVTVGEKERIVIKASYSKRFNKVATESHEETSTDEEDDEDESESSDYSGEGNDSDLVDSSKYKKISDEEIQRIIQEYRVTSFKNLQRRFHLSYQTLRNILIENGVELRQTGKKVTCDTIKDTEATQPQLEEEVPPQTSVKKENNKQKTDTISQNAPGKQIDFSLIAKTFEDANVSTLLHLYIELNRHGNLLVEDLLKDYKFPMEFLRFATTNPDEYIKNLVTKMYLLGYSVDSIAVRIKRSSNFVRKFIPDEMMREANDRSQSRYTGERLSEEEKKAIKKFYLNGMSLSEISEQFSISLATVRRYALSN